MVFRRREKRGWLQLLTEFFYPRGGWRRAAQYVKHRLQRLPDTPERICRGIWAGVFVAFTPFFGLHFILAALLARLMRGNVLSSLMGTFFGNPLTYVPIGVSALWTGHWMLGSHLRPQVEDSFGRMFAKAGRDLWGNIRAMFTSEAADWRSLSRFYDEVFWPYMVGGLVTGAITATACYYIFLPLITTYQKRRKAKLRAKLAQLKKQAKLG